MTAPPALLGVQPVLHPDLAGLAADVTWWHDQGPAAALRLAAALGYLRLRVAGLEAAGLGGYVDAAAAALRDGRPIPATSVVGQYRAESAAILTGRITDPP
jgi:hypothetical protein